MVGNTGPGPDFSLGSAQPTHGAVRLGPVKSIDGACANCAGSTFSDSGKPCVCQAPPLNARTKICWLAPLFCENVAHGTRALPAVTVPADRSLKPAFWPGSI